MRMRRKKHFEQRWCAAAPGLLVEDPAARKGRWCGGRRDVRLELGCGKGLYLAQQAARDPDTLCVGLEKNPTALLLAMELAQREELANAAFIRGDAEQISLWFHERELSRLDVLFCDPWPEPKREARRLTHRRFLSIYFSLLKPGGLFCLRTDNNALFEFSLRELAACGLEPVSVTRDLHGGGGDIGEDMTGYEQKFAAEGKPIYQVKCQSSSAPSLHPLD